MSSNPYRKDFPLLENNKVIYLDNAATSQRPEAVIQAEAQFYEKYNANRSLQNACENLLFPDPIPVFFF